MIKKLALFLILLSTDLVFATSDSTSSLSIEAILQEQPLVYYQDGFLYFEGFDGPGFIEIYSIIGNKITEISTQELNEFKSSISLESGHMYIIRVNSNREIKTFKIVTSQGL
ncbi:MAG: T9SS type A sorting domain-containing protein [Flavobacteriaceae bacterium]|nr:T9SS type A sorting domain-containing protein [Flavobacteriaceae bacterium]